MGTEGYHQQGSRKTNLEKENGLTTATLREVRGSVGAEREQWRLATQAEVQSLRDNDTGEVVSKAELRAIKNAGSLPMKLAAGTTCDVPAGTERNQIRAVVCGNF